MEIEVKAEPSLAEYDTGNGAHETKVTVFYNPHASTRVQRRTIIFETLLAHLRILGHDKVEMITDGIEDALDQWGGQ